MPAFRRARHVFLRIEDEEFPDFPALLRGTARLTTIRRVWATSVLGGESYPLTAEQIELLAAMPRDDWVEAGDVAARHGVREVDLVELAREGLIVTDAGDPTLAELRRRDDRIRADGWNAWAAAYHFLTRWKGVDLGVTEAESPEEARMMADFLEREGPPPDHFHALPSETLQPLPAPGGDGALYEVLSRRRTTRQFHPDRPMNSEQLSTLLFWVFGCHGLIPITDRFVMLKKTSPSGGGLHPTEAYLLVRRVDGVAPGLYHYRADRHALGLLRPLSGEEAADTARRLTAGQGDLAAADLLVLLTTRFARNFWKYPEHDRAYAVLLMDAAHLSQTFYLVCAELGLGAFVTAAVNGDDIERALGIWGAAEGAIAICGCGRLPDRPPASDVVPFRPA